MLRTVTMCAEIGCAGGLHHLGFSVSPQDGHGVGIGRESIVNAASEPPGA